VALEFHSLSKTYNMTGWRIGMAVGNAEMVNALLTVKSNLDSGVPQAIQQMGIEALGTSSEWIDRRNAVYQGRRDKVLKALRSIGLHVDPPKASLYVWANVPDGYTSAEFTERLLDECDVVVTPGTGYGRYGEGYIRLSLTIEDDQLEEGLRRLVNWAARRSKGGDQKTDN
jgi:LL-diaminopimelate aminotransferase